VIVLDTHAPVWRVSDTARLSTRAKRTIAVQLESGPLIASAISVLEIVTAVRRGRLALRTSVDQRLADLRSLPELRFEPVSAGIAELAGSYDDALPGDPAARIIVATAGTLKAKLVSADERLRKSRAVPLVW
jgi:PIN domain nuclease of toxin-antitoxin system